MRKRSVAPYPTHPTRPLEHSHCRAKPTRTVRVHCEHILMWCVCTGRTRRSGRSVYTGNPTRTVRERIARRGKLPVYTRPCVDKINYNWAHPLHMRICILWQLFFLRMTKNRSVFIHTIVANRSINCARYLYIL